MKSTMIMAFVGAVASLTVSATAAVVPQPLDVWVPRITSPTASTIWQIGKTANVTWDTSDAPASISNQFAVTLTGTSTTLASGFNPLAGIVEFTVPSSVTPGTHQITLFGDSGNVSPAFSVTN